MKSPTLKNINQAQEDQSKSEPATKKRQTPDHEPGVSSSSSSTPGIASAPETSEKPANRRVRKRRKSRHPSSNVRKRDDKYKYRMTQLAGEGQHTTPGNPAQTDGMDSGMRFLREINIVAQTAAGAGTVAAVISQLGQQTACAVAIAMTDRAEEIFQKDLKYLDNAKTIEEAKGVPGSPINSCTYKYLKGQELTTGEVVAKNRGCSDEISPTLPEYKTRAIMYMTTVFRNKAGKCDEPMPVRFCPKCLMEYNSKEAKEAREKKRIEREEEEADEEEEEEDNIDGTPGSPSGEDSE